ncbi:MAG: Smr/MutS family protein [Lachnospiraceae bacterium]|nr:Smr/MutS family protein [Lachnospiraceae bacterium]
MNLSSGIIEIDLHGMRAEEAIKAVKKEVARASAAVYTIRVIHGYHGGTSIRSAVMDEFSYGRNPKVIRVKPGNNPGITELVLREM